MDDYGVDLDEIARVIERADVLVVRFQVIEKRLLVDFRSSGSEGPIIKMVDPVSSIEERFRELKSLRPSFALPTRILSFRWPRSLRALEQAGIVAMFRDRLSQLGFEDAAPQADRAYDDLVQEERAVLEAVIRGGEGFQTVWERSA